MHQEIAVIVYAHTQPKALDEARRALEWLVDWKHFDYYEINKGVLADSSRGEEIIIGHFKWTQRKFIDNLKIVKEAILNHSDQALMEFGEVSGYHDMFKFYCNQLGQYEGNSIEIYDSDASGIYTKKHLSDATNRWKCIYEDKGLINPYKNKGVWVVTAEVHS